MGVMFESLERAFPLILKGVSPMEPEGIRTKKDKNNAG